MSESLYEKICSTEPGRHAHGIAEFVYNHPSTLKKRGADQLAGAQAYLEKLALAEVEELLPTWARELQDRRDP